MWRPANNVASVSRNSSISPLPDEDAEMHRIQTRTITPLTARFICTNCGRYICTICSSFAEERSRPSKPPTFIGQTTTMDIEIFVLPVGAGDSFAELEIVLQETIALQCSHFVFTNES